MAMRMKARKAKALKPVWGGQLAADRASELQLVVGKLLEEEEVEEVNKEKEGEGSKDSK